MTQWLEEFKEGYFYPAVLDFAATAVGIMLTLLLGAALTYGIILAFRRIGSVDSIAARFPEANRNEYRKQFLTLLGLVKNICLMVTWAIIALMVIGRLGVEIGPILAGAGILGIALGLGAQSLIRDLIGGFFHILENQIRVGDVARINGVGGIVEEITYRLIVLRDIAHNVHIFPHGKVETLTNFTKEYSGAVLDIKVAYKEDVQQVVATIQQAALAMREEEEWRERILDTPEILGVDDFLESGVVIRMRFKTQPIEQWAVGREFRRRIKAAFDREGIEIAIPHRRVYVAGQGEQPTAAALLATLGDGDDSSHPLLPAEEKPALPQSKDELARAASTDKEY